MLWTIFILLLILWLIGIITSFTFGGLIHVLLILAFIILLVKIFHQSKSV